MSIDLNKIAIATGGYIVEAALITPEMMELYKLFETLNDLLWNNQFRKALIIAQKVVDVSLKTKPNGFDGDYHAMVANTFVSIAKALKEFFVNELGDKYKQTLSNPRESLTRKDDIEAMRYISKMYLEVANKMRL